jgi:hypothetical protein
MKVTIGPDTTFPYSTAARRFPVEVAISSEIPVEVSSRIDICTALLTRVGEDEAAYGYVRRVLPFTRDFVTLSPDRPLRVTVDVLENEDNFDGFSAHDYRCDIKAEFYMRDGDDPKRVEFSGSFVVNLR